MSMNVKVGGAWKEVAIPSMKVGGVWKDATEGWVKVAGVWRKFYPELITPTVIIGGSLYNTNTGVKTVSGISVNAGDMIVALAASTGTPGGGSVSDNVFGAYGQAINAVFASQRQCGIHVQYASVNATINVSFTPSINETGGGLTVVILRGGLVTQQVYLQGKSDDVATGVPTCGLNAAPAINDVVLGIATAITGVTVGAGFTTAGSGSWASPTNIVLAQYKNGNASSSVSWATSSSNHCCCAVGYKPQ